MPTLTQALGTFLKVDRSTYTNRSYGYCLAPFVTAIGPDRDIRLVTYDDLLDYVSRLRKTVSQSSLVQYVQIIRTFFTWCVRIRYLDFSPAAALTVRRPPEDPTLSRAMPPEVLEMLEERFRSHPRNYAILLFIAQTGCRIGAVATLTIEHLKLDQRMAMVLEKGSRYYWVYFEEEAAEALRRWLEVRPKAVHDFVFVDERSGRPLKRNSLSSIIRRATQDMLGGKGYGAHSIRHLCIADLVEIQEDPHTMQFKLGHKKLTTTMKYMPRSNPHVPAATSRLVAYRRRRSKSAGKIIPLDDAG